MHEGLSRIEELPGSQPWTAACITAEAKHHNAMPLVAMQAGRSGSKYFVCRQLLDRTRTYLCIHAILFNASLDTSEV